MKSVVRIYDRAFAETGISGDFVSLSHTEKFREAGSAELVLPIGSAAADILMPDGYIRVPEGIFYRIISVGRDLREGLVTARCEGLLSLLKGTVFPQEYGLVGEAAALMYVLVRNSVGNLPLSLTLGSTVGEKSVLISSGRSDLYSDLVSLCYLGDMGMKMEYDGERLLFSARLQNDRTSGSSDPVLISRKMGTFESQRFFWDFDAYRNVAVVSGAEKEDGSRYTMTVRSDEIDLDGDFPDGEYFDRQMLVNFTAPVRPYMYENAEGLLELNESEYLAAMKSAGTAALGRCRPKIELWGKTDSSDIAPGDRVTVVDAETGISGTAVAESVVTTYSDDGRTVETEFLAAANG